MFIIQVLLFLANRNAEKAILSLFLSVNYIKIGEHVALLTGPTVYSIYCDLAPSAIVLSLPVSSLWRHHCPRQQVCHMQLGKKICMQCNMSIKNCMYDLRKKYPPLSFTFQMVLSLLWFNNVFNVIPQPRCD